MFKNFIHSSDLSDLQMSLIAIGFFILVAIVLSNFIRSYKISRKKKTIDRVNAAIIAAGDSSGRLEPGTQKKLNSHTALNAGLDAQSQSQNEVKAKVTEENHAHAIARIDPSIDCVVLFKFPVPTTGAEIFEHLMSWPKSPLYRYLIEGLGYAEDPVQAQWGLVSPRMLYTELQASVQLANRRGPIGVVDLSEFLSKCQSLAESLDAEIDLPPVNSVLEQANSIDEFALNVDIQLGFQLRSNMISWDAKEVENALQNRGFILSRDGGYFHFYEQNQTLFKVKVEDINFLRDDLQNRRIKNIQFLLDVPLAPVECKPFSSMLSKAAELAVDLDGRLLDDHGQPLTEPAIHGIGGHLYTVYQMMQTRDIIPGSTSATRLFS